MSVGSAIALSSLTPGITLTGVPGSTRTGVVNMVVSTNNSTGYSVTVQAARSTLDPVDTTANTDTIATGDLQVRKDGSTPGTYAAVSNEEARTVHTQSSGSAAGGDALTNVYQIVVPFVNADTYSVNLDYVASTLSSAGS